MYVIDNLDIFYLAIKILILAYFIFAIIAFLFINRIRNEVIAMHEEIFYMNRKLNKIMKLINFKEEKKGTRLSAQPKPKDTNAPFLF